MTIVHRAMVSVFDLFLAHTDTVAHGAVREYVYIVSTKMELEHAINHENVVWAHVNSLRAKLYAKIPILDKHYTQIHQKSKEIMSMVEFENLFQSF